MMSEGIKTFAKIIELIKEKKKFEALTKYANYSKMPLEESRKYIDQLEEKILIF